MKKKMIMLGILLLPVMGLAENAAAPTDYYQQALEAYLSGDVDQAILIDTKALQANPKDQKASNLLELLVQEKSRAAQSVIWIGSEASPSQQPAQAGPVEEPQAKPLRVRVLKADSSQWEAKIQALSLLLTKDAASREKEMAEAQAADAAKINQLEGELKSLHEKEGGFGGLLNFWVILLALLVSLLSLYSSWRARREARRLRATLKPRDREETPKKILDFRRFGN